MNDRLHSPEVEQDSASQKAVDTSVSTFVAYLRLMRIGNVFTAFANILMGFLVVQSETDPPGITANNVGTLLGLLLLLFFPFFPWRKRKMVWVLYTNHVLNLERS